MISRDQMSVGTKKYRDFYEMKPNSSIIQREFGFYSMDRWKAEGHIDDNTNIYGLIQCDENGVVPLGHLGWVTAEFSPEFEIKHIEDRGTHEVEQDEAGRHVLYFKGRRSGFMPEYLDHPVKDMKSWQENCKWRLDPKTPDRYIDFESRVAQVKIEANQGKIIQQNLIGGYMYLRSLIGPLELLYKFYDEPELIHDCMETWLNLSDAVIAKTQQEVTIDELFLAEDICYNHGPLISPDMVREFLFPYYQQLIKNVKGRQLEKSSLEALTKESLPKAKTQ